MPATKATITAAQQRLAKAYSPETLATASKVWRDELIEHFRGLATRTPNALNWHEPEENIAHAKSFLKQRQASDSLGDLSEQTGLLIRLSLIHI